MVLGSQAASSSTQSYNVRSVTTRFVSQGANEFGCRFVHGGYELLLNSYLIHYFKATITGATLGARHNMEVCCSLG